ncbi:hypothetical protein F441_22155 [Phytophthora nicotianae CJ01A1]|uniref:Uncharacterized protein n=6 Tax=Phytophthora nicotianae TaxID=4792 RepID=W2PDR8_PHYN3|nr:hypothetical protein PPTG_24469 [Phytophthora nicotianae INRA-310]ETI30637.1 hypothetical protein F443_22253 [Phytophthora nicotianae P1569]ETK71040.1 hypothetical protein L915_21643 [Phytophthora nicotianae]ETO59389.1 hypothetical protein F444_22246 [Phytophthora nicotianae P1976]ETP00430.1 hypothetical protein F441_22155 [Phytophthora nicotianae CJ01A1]ETP28586.1 hypothetical protein F442_22124 [Phytophthora nicotianae P10297]
MLVVNTMIQESVPAGHEQPRERSSDALTHVGSRQTDCVVPQHAFEQRRLGRRGSKVR